MCARVRVHAGGWAGVRVCVRAGVQAWKTLHLTIVILHMSHSVTKSSNDLCAQQRFRSAWASAQSDQSICCLLEETLGSQLPMSTQQKLIKLGGCSG